MCPGDFKLMLVRYSPEGEFEFNPGLQTLGLTGTFRGHAGRVDALGKLAEDFDSLEIEPAYVVDLGDRVLSLGFFRARARESGVPLEQKLVQLITPGRRAHSSRKDLLFVGGGGASRRSRPERHRTPLARETTETHQVGVQFLPR
jgi:hypothetical protein